MTEIELRDAALEPAELADCDLTGARLASATSANCTLRRCRVTGLVNPARLAGARMTIADALDAVETLAAAAGIELLPEGDSG